jgi:multidrug efflux system membrane fusion protein
MSNKRNVVCFHFFVLLLAASQSGCKRGDHQSANPTPVHANVQRREVMADEDTIVSPGQVVGSNTVIVRSRIDGPLVSVVFHEGQDVRKGDPLAYIDDANYQLALDQAVANRDKDLAALDDARAGYRRQQELLSAGIMARQDFEKQQAAFHQMEAAVRADATAIDQARLNLSFTKISAPITGRIGFRGIDVGNIVHANDSSLATITQLHPIAVVCYVPANEWRQFATAFHDHRNNVTVFAEDGKTVLGYGRITTTDTSLDVSTGAVKVKAEFANDELKLWPNEYVQVAIRVR